MVNYVTLNGNTYSDGSTDEGTGKKYLANGGHKTNFIPSLSDYLVESSNRIAATGLSLKSTSTDSLTVANTGSISANIGASKGFTVGSRVRFAYSTDTTKYMEGVITAYDQVAGSTSITLDNSGGSGTFASWNVSIAGDKGSVGATGAPGTNGINGTTAGDFTTASNITTLDVNDLILVKQYSSGSLVKITFGELLNSIRAQL